MDLEQRLLIKKNLDILLRRKKTLVLFLLLGIAGGVFYYLQQPKIYESTALLQYQRQNVNPTALTPDDSRTLTRDVVDTVGLQVTRRSSLEEIIRQFNLYPDRQATMPMEKLVGSMRKNNITIQLLEGGDVFEVSFKGNDQQKVRDVANALAQRFIDENKASRQHRASQTSAYIMDELEIVKKSLDEKQKTMRDYKKRYHNEMADQLLNNTSRLNALQEQYQALQNNRLTLEQTRLQVQDRMAERMAQLYQQTLDSAATTGSGQGSGNLTSADQIRLRLQSLQPRYTDNHPEIKRLKKLLRNREAASGDPAATEPSGGNLEDSHLSQLKQQLENIDFSISRLRDERENMRGKIVQYEEWIAAAPTREAEWAALTRDYEQLHEYYQRLVTQSLQADSAVSLENQLQGSQFRIIDSAHFPEKPIEPEFMLILMVSVALGLGIGGGLSYSHEFLGTSFKNPVDLEKFLDLPVVCALPNVLTKRELRRRKAVSGVRTIFLAFFGVTVLSGIFYFWQQGMIIL